MITFYHGTSDVFQIKKVLLPPIITEIKREEWRKKIHRQSIFYNINFVCENVCKKKPVINMAGNQ